MLRWEGSTLDALLLDLDDTLLDNRSGLEAAKDALAALLADRLGDAAAGVLRAGFDAEAARFWTDEACHRWGRLDMAGARRAIVTRVLEELGRPDPRLATEAAAFYSEVRERSYALFDGALEVLSRLRARAPALGLVTNGAAEAQRAKIERFDLARWFDVVVVEGEFGAGKPDPRVFAHALGAVGARAAASLMAGDNYECDVLGALRAGLHAVWIEPGGRRAAVSAPPATTPGGRPRTLASVAELADALGA